MYLLQNVCITVSAASAAILLEVLHATEKGNGGSRPAVSGRQDSMRMRVTLFAVLRLSKTNSHTSDQQHAMRTLNAALPQHIRNNTPPHMRPTRPNVHACMHACGCVKAYWPLVCVMMLMGASSSVGSMGITIAVERKMTKVLCAEDKAALGRMNAGVGGGQGGAGQDERRCGGRTRRRWAG